MTRQSLSTTLLLSLVLFVLMALRTELTAPASLPDLTSGDAGVLRAPFGAWINGVGNSMGVVLKWVIAYLILNWNALIITRIAIRNQLLLERSFLAFPLVVIVSMGLGWGALEMDAQVASLLVVGACDHLFRSFRRQALYSEDFDAALLLGCAVLIYTPATWLVGWLLFSLFALKKGWREWIVIFVALLLPLLICSYVYWGFGYELSYLGVELLESFKSTLTPALFLAWFPIEGAVAMGVLLIVMMMGTIYSITHRGYIRTRPYKILLSVHWLVLFSLAAMLFSYGFGESLLLLSIPSALLIPAFVIRQSKRWERILIPPLLICYVLYNVVAIVLQ